MTRDGKRSRARNEIAALITRLFHPSSQVRRAGRGAKLRTDYLPLERLRCYATALGGQSVLCPLFAPGSLGSTRRLRRQTPFATKCVFSATRILRRANRAAGYSDFPLTGATGIRRAADARRVLTGSIHAGTYDAGLRRLTRALTARFATTASNGRHVLAIPAHRHAALTASRACFSGIEFVRRALGMGSSAALASDFLLLRLVHRGKATCTLASTVRACAIGARRQRSVSVAPRLVDHVTLALTIRPTEAAVVIACSIHHYCSLP
jgi:hypothetical protein